MQGHCLCGAVTVTVAGAHDARIDACHCRMCQRWSGGVFLAFDATATAVSVTGEVRTYRSSPFSQRAFCPACGSHLWLRNVGGDGIPAPDAGYELMPGLFESARPWPLRSEIYIDRAMESARLSGTHPRITRADYEADNPSVEGDME